MIPKMRSGFTLIELIVVIIIVGILAAVGISQYSKTVEKGRGAEARMTLGNIRNLAYQYYLENGTLATITSADLNIGTSPDQVPGDTASACRSTHYFWYQPGSKGVNTLQLTAWRCGSGGKTPQGTAGLYLNFMVGPGYGDTWNGNGGY